MESSKTVFITGATDGIGRELAKSLAKDSYDLILHGRNPQRGEELIAELTTVNSSNNYKYLNADFASLEEVNQLANEINRSGINFDILVNNAGVIMKSKEMTIDGFEQTFAVNHLAMFSLTVQILANLQNNDKLRILNVSSQMHSSSLDLDNLQSEKSYSPSSAYAQSKLLNILFTFKLDKLLHNSEITVNCLHPGVINTKMLRSLWGGSGPKFSQTLEDLVRSAKLDNVSGKYFRDSVTATPSKIAFDEALQDRIWMLSEQYSGVKFSGLN